jgi:hypothetical protein
LIKADSVSSRPEATFVLLLMQSLFWLIAGISAAPFVLGGEVFMAALATASLLLALGTCLVTIGIEALCLFGTALLLVLPLGFNRGPVSLLVNIVLPIAVILLVRKDEGAYS